MNRLHVRRLAALLAAAGALTACASTAPHPDDPIEGANRAAYGFQTHVVDTVFDPITKGYRAVVPEPGRDAVHNVLSNLERPKSILNHLLQAEPGEALAATGALAIDSTIGLAGLWRPAECWGVADRSTGFADTLTGWGVGRGVYVVLPLLGAGGTRALVGRVADSLADPTRWVLGDGARLAITGTTILDVRERTLDARERIQETADDPYAATRARFLGEGDADPGVREEDRARWIR